MTILYSDPIFLRHETGRHVEVPACLRSVTTRLEARGLSRQCTTGTYASLRPERVTRVHEPDVVQRARQVAEFGGGMLDADTACPGVLGR
jgi:acetoin utilization deacetylase AcuC-like enzyme